MAEDYNLQTSELISKEEKFKRLNEILIIEIEQ